MVCTLSLEQDTCYLAIGPVVLQGLLIGQPQAMVGDYNGQLVPLFGGEKLRTEETEHLPPSITCYASWRERNTLLQLNSPCSEKRYLIVGAGKVDRGREYYRLQGIYSSFTR